ncbi:(Fe-S)-binding protein [Flavobacteriales bacterium]|nr:(Fe-S)-binding protein [Flavobacteriales bacterium]
MQFLPSILFAIIFFSASFFFVNNCKKIYRNINLGGSLDRFDNKKERFLKMSRLAFGQSKMLDKPIVGLLHLIVYVAFILINIELLEIVLDGFTGKHRVLAPFLGTFYNFLIGFFEVLALLVIISVLIFWIRRNILKIKRFISKDLIGWPKNDADYILFIEFLLMMLFLNMNATDSILQNASYSDLYQSYGYFPVSQFFTPIYEGFSLETIHIVERTSWWMHILGILFFLNYLYYSKHLHILLAFPNTYFSNLEKKGKSNNLKSVYHEIKLMIDPSYKIPNDELQNDTKFGASDIFDLNWFQLLSAYTCTECGRCSNDCPATQTGKLLSPRKIMMKTRDRVEDVSRNIDKNKIFVSDGKTLLNDYISKEEIWACTTCNACVESCPIGIDPLSIIIDMRRYMVMEESTASNEINTMMSNIENNGAPWPFNKFDRINWRN